MNHYVAFIAGSLATMLFGVVANILTPQIRELYPKIWNWLVQTSIRIPARFVERRIEKVKTEVEQISKAVESTPEIVAVSLYSILSGVRDVKVNSLLICLVVVVTVGASLLETNRRLLPLTDNVYLLYGEKYLLQKTRTEPICSISDADIVWFPPPRPAVSGDSIDIFLVASLFALVAFLVIIISDLGGSDLVTKMYKISHFQEYKARREKHVGDLENFLNKIKK